MEGQLFKYTNVVKGWQYRWFVLNPEAGRLEYYEVKIGLLSDCTVNAGTNARVANGFLMKHISINYTAVYYLSLQMQMF